MAAGCWLQNPLFLPTMKGIKIISLPIPPRYFTFLVLLFPTYTHLQDHRFASKHFYSRMPAKGKTSSIFFSPMLFMGLCILPSVSTSFKPVGASPPSKRQLYNNILDVFDIWAGRFIHPNADPPSAAPGGIGAGSSGRHPCKDNRVRGQLRCSGRKFKARPQLIFPALHPWLTPLTSIELSRISISWEPNPL